MKEFVEKLIGRLEKQAEQYRRRGFEHEQKGYSTMADKYYGKQCSYLHSIEIVNQLAEEYNNEVCEWKITFNKDIHREYKPLCSEDGFIDMTGYFDYKYCPYCGKKIKVVD